MVWPFSAIDERCALGPVIVTWCGEESVLCQVMVWPLLTTTVSGPNLKSAIETTPGPGAGFAMAPSVVPFIGLVVLLLLVRRSLSSLTATVGGEAGVIGRGGLPAPIIEAQVESDVDRNRRIMRERVEALARERPDVAAQLIRSWLVEKRS